MKLFSSLPLVASFLLLLVDHAVATTADKSRKTHLKGRQLSLEESRFPRVYTAIIPTPGAIAAPPFTENADAASLIQSFVNQVDFLKEVKTSRSSSDESSVEIALLVHSEKEFNSLQSTFTDIIADVWSYQSTSASEEHDSTLLIHQDLTAGIHAELDYASDVPPTSLDASGKQLSQYSTISGFPCYKNLQGTFDWMDAMVIKGGAIPNLSVTVEDIGDSYLKTVNSNAGHDMRAMVITGSGAAGSVTNKAIFFAMSGIHAREYAPPELTSRWAESLIDAYNTDADITVMLDWTEIHIVFHSNPDGRQVAESNRPAYRRKNMNKNNRGDCDEEGEIGVDLNRNFPFQWGRNSGSSNNKCGQTYRGPSPASEPEVKAIINYCERIFPEGQRKADPLREQQTPYDEDTTMGIFFDVHSYGSMMIWPWSYADAATGNDIGLRSFINKMIHFNNYDYAGDSNGFLYAASGVTADWGYGALGAAAAVFEIGSEFYESCSSFESNVVDGNMKALTYSAKTAHAPYSLSKGPDVTTLIVNVQDTTLVVIADASDSAWSLNNFPTAQQGVQEIRFFVNVHPLDTSAGAPPSGTLIGIFGGSTVDISSLPAGRHTVYVQAKDGEGYKGPVTAAFFEFDGADSPSTSPSASPSIQQSSLPSQSSSMPSATPSAAPLPSSTPSTLPSAVPQPSGSHFPSSAPSVALPTEAPTPPFVICFSGETKVTVKDIGTVLMKNLQVGDEVLVSLDNEIYQPVYSFGHRHSAMSSVEYLQLSPSMLELSANHMVYVEGKGAVPSSMVEVGDRLEGSNAEVSGIKKVLRRGAYAPFTTTGTIVVNGAVASSYVAFQESPVLLVGSLSTHLSYQWLAHSFQLPHRIWCYHLGSCEEADYTAEGISKWVYQPLIASQWLLKQNSLLILLLFIPLFLVLGLFSIIEALVQNPSGLVLLCTIICIATTCKVRGTKSV